MLDAQPGCQNAGNDLDPAGVGRVVMRDEQNLHSEQTPALENLLLHLPDRERVLRRNV